MTLYQKHVTDWGTCTRCPLHLGRRSVVLTRGELPCDILFIGEAPGKSEDVIGKPFIGPAGKLLDHIIKLYVLDSYRLAFTNVVACIPLGMDGEKTSEPEHEHIKKCHPRLIEIAKIARPRLIVLVGKLSSRYAKLSFNDLGFQPHYVDIDHPAHILRLNQAQQGLSVQRAGVRLKCAIEEVFNAGTE